MPVCSGSGFVKNDLRNQLVQSYLCGGSNWDSPDQHLLEVKFGFLLAQPEMLHKQVLALRVEGLPIAPSPSKCLSFSTGLYMPARGFHSVLCAPCEGREIGNLDFHPAGMCQGARCGGRACVTVDPQDETSETRPVGISVW